jgi:hypothetical protein
MEDKYLNQIYRQTRQDVYNTMDLLKDKLDNEDTDINWGHVGDLGHIRENLIDTYCFASGSEPDEVTRKLNEYRQSNTYPGIKKDLDTLLERISFCEVESELAAEGEDMAISADRRFTAQYLADVFNTANKGQFAEAYEHAQGLTPVAASHIPQRLYDFLSQYE